MIRRAAILVLLACIAGCHDKTEEPPPPPVVVSGSLSPTSVDLQEDENVTLQPSELLSDGTSRETTSSDWTTSDPAVATVTSAGVVTAVAVGTATITATFGGVTGVAHVTVTPSIANTILLTGAPTSSMVPGATVTLVATVKDALGSTLTGPQYAVTWSSSVPDIATVSSSGLVTAVDPGTVTITARAGTTLEANVGITVASGVVVGVAGGSVTSPDGNVTITVPSGALSQSVAFQVVLALNPPTSPYLLGPAYQLTTAPANVTFKMPVTFSQKYSLANEPAGTPEGTNSLGTVSNGGWVSLPGSQVELAVHAAQAALLTSPQFLAVLGGAAWAVVDDYSEGDALTDGDFPAEIDLCVGERDFFSLGGFGTSIGVTTLPTGVVAASSTSNFVLVEGVTPGATSIIYTGNGLTSVDLGVVFSCLPRGGLILTGQSGNAYNLFKLPTGTAAVTQQTSNNESRYPTLGLAPLPPGVRGASLRQGDDATPLAYKVVTGATYNETIYWNGSSGSPVIVTPPANSNNIAAAFVDNGPFLFAPNVGGASEVWGVPVGGNTATKLTNLNGTMNYIATSPDGNMYFDWHPNTVGVTSHIYRLAVPAIGSTPPTSGQVQITTGAGQTETQPAVSQNGKVLAYAKSDATGSFSRVFIQDLALAGAAPIQVSPSTGYAYIPAFCGNGTVYFAYSTSFSGPYQLYSWNVATRTPTLVAATAGIAIADLTIARLDGDGGRHSCP